MENCKHPPRKQFLAKSRKPHPDTGKLADVLWGMCGVCKQPMPDVFLDKFGRIEK
jgi:hypothetical protein